MANGAKGRRLSTWGPPSGLATRAAWTAKGDEQSDFYGNSVNTAGDVNGDGFDDVIVGARLYDGGQHDEGRAFVYLGSASGLSDTAAWMAEGNQVSAQLGWSVATAGDVNGDGYDDVIVGAPSYDNGQVDEGRAFVYLGSAAGLGTSATWTGEGNQPGVQFGHSVRLAGDVNGDGYDDVTIGVPFFEGGIVVIVPGSATGPQTGSRGIVNGPNGELGFSAGAAGDVNGDGFGDVIAGAPLFSRLGRTEEGVAMITLGRSG
jgi:hypothetical protein